MKEKNRKRGILFTLKFIIRRFPGYFWISLLYHVVMDTMMTVHNVWIYYMVIDILSSGRPAVQLLAVVLLLIAYSAATGVFCRWYEEVYRPEQEEQLTGTVKSEVLERVVQLDMQVYDDPEFYNRVVLNLEGAHEKIIEIMQICMMIMGSILSILMSLAIYAGMGMTYFGFILIFVGLSIQLSKRIAAKQFARKERLIPWERKWTYFSNLLMRRNSAQDVRLYGADKIFKRQYNDSVDCIKKTAKKDGLSIALFGFLQGFIIEQLILHFGAMTYLAYAVVVAQTIGLAQFVTAFKGISVVADTLNLIFGRYLPQMHECGMFTASFREFMECGEEKTDSDGGKRDGETASDALEDGRALLNGADRVSILMENIVFSYPGCEKPVIDHLFLSVPAGKRVAVVGFNGAGKSTLVKLLLGLYKPQSGVIRLGGRDLVGMSKGDHDSFGLLFQNFNLYAASVASNIAMDTAYDAGRAAQAMEESGFGQYEDLLEDGLLTEVTKEFSSNGIQLSGGQQQLLASSRLYYGNRTFFILDEPSSALDPRMELEMNRRVWKLTEGVTTVIISHRLSMTKNADLICYMENGKIAEKGTHEELLSAGGRYASLWKAQAENYQM